MAQCSVTPKVCLLLLTVIFWGGAAGLLYIGTSVYLEFNEYEKVTQYMYTLLPAAIIMGVAGFLFLVGLIGCVGAFKEQKCLLGVYFTVLLIVFLGLAAGGVVGYIYRFQVEDGLTSGLNEGLEHYGNDSIWTDEIDFMQQELRCCGVHNYTDWMDTPWHTQHPNATAPDSCYMDKNIKNTTMPDYQNGCYSLVRKQFMDNLGIIAGVCCAFAVVLLTGMVCSCVLLCRRRTEQPYIGLSSPEHLRV